MAASVVRLFRLLRCGGPSMQPVAEHLRRIDGARPGPGKDLFLHFKDTPFPHGAQLAEMRPFGHRLGRGVHGADLIDVGVRVSGDDRFLVDLRRRRRLNENPVDARIAVQFPDQLQNLLHRRIRRQHALVGVNAELSALSWDAFDNRLSLSTLWEKYNQIISRPKMDPFCTMFLVGFANASFCALFGGDWTSRSIVFSATLIGFYLKQVMQKKHLNHYIVFVVSAFIASLVASSALTLETTAEVAIATSVLYLVPGVPLLNGVIDIVEGHSLTGCARLIQALLLVLCIAVGLSGTLILVKNGLL